MLKDYNISDFIGVYEKALPVELCNKILTEFESNNYNKKSIDDYRKQTVEIQMFEDFNKPLGQISLQLQQILQNYINRYEKKVISLFPLANLKIKPKTGTLVIHPCGSPFWHAGLKTQENKYIITGWLQYAVNIELMQTEKITTLEG